MNYELTSLFKVGTIPWISAEIRNNLWKSNNMNKILKLDQIPELTESLQNKTIVLAGGCFDILHVGHINFLQSAKKHGDVLIVLLESDEMIKKSKGANRPINSQNDRATILAELESVDFVIPLPELKSNEEYDRLVILIKPAIIAATEGDQYIVHKKRQAQLINAQVILVNKLIKDQSTSRIANLLEKEL